MSDIEVGDIVRFTRDSPLNPDHFGYEGQSAVVVSTSEFNDIHVKILSLRPGQVSYLGGRDHIGVIPDRLEKL